MKVIKTFSVRNAYTPETREQKLKVSKRRSLKMAVITAQYALGRSCFAPSDLQSRSLPVIPIEL